ncbi:NADH-quinone oxidoreductase subunit NuoF [Ammonifex thiophilus]|uniref:NADH-quinone oxidoreductase subunit NuoF n=2 Tax=Ammonifex thiophilus TaxID=444093 RepID=A0A3D8P8V3_9THEO|nr:NADH-quinone oxidoreductase subunit NuoF [Ammonifex thiophilus]
MTRITSRHMLERMVRELAEKRARAGLVVKVCQGTGCLAAGAEETFRAFQEEIARQGVKAQIVPTGCQGFCQGAPVITVEPRGWFLHRVTAADVPKVVDVVLKRGGELVQHFYRDPQTGEICRRPEDMSFFRHQLKIALRNLGKINPLDIEDYLAVGGYTALAKVLTEMTPEEVIEEVKKSGLRGRGGAGFPTGVKWEGARRAPGARKFVICNGDEGDPGAFMDASLMEGDPHSIIEGMIICAYAIGDCREGYIYVREEYPLAVKRLGIALEQARAWGLLGENILGTGFSFDIQLKKGAGAFVCGESTTLMMSIEGKRPSPRVTPPRSVEKGLWGMPTCLNNVETFANIPIIILKGGEWYAQYGTETSKGTKAFCITGKVRNTGLIEVPMGMTLREIVQKLGGGMLGEARLKAVQTGGPSGGCIPEEYLDTPVDYESLTRLGSMMGSGGMVVVDEGTCMVEFARFFLNFTQQESCGKCPPCRIGTYEMLQILNRIVAGEGREGDIELLEELGRKIKETSLCGLGQSAPNPVLSTIKYFREEYEAHIREKRCPARTCTKVGKYVIGEDCVQCGWCRDTCPHGAILERRDGFYIEPDLCKRCGACLGVCPVGAIYLEAAGGEKPWPKPSSVR